MRRISIWGLEPLTSRLSLDLLLFTRPSPASGQAGNLITDAIRWRTQSDVAIVNGGGIRASLPGGSVERREVLQMLPFLNEVQIVTVSGATLRAALAHGLSYLAAPDAISSPDGRHLQLSGVRVEWRIEEQEVQLVRAELQTDDGTRTAIKDDQTYTVATMSFLISGGDDFEFTPISGISSLGVTVADVMASYLAALAPNASVPLHVDVGGRIVQLAEMRHFKLGLFCSADEGQVSYQLTLTLPEPDPKPEP